MFFGCSSRNQEVWVVGFGLVDSLALVLFNLHISFHIFFLVFYSWINPQTFGTRLKWSWLNKTPIFDHFPVDSTSHLHTLYCKRFVRLRVLIKTHITHHHTDLPSSFHPCSDHYLPTIHALSRTTRSPCVSVSRAPRSTANHHTPPPLLSVFFHSAD
jgi:hypothetical protein